ncbi:unnamed protein product [Coffea canephora]|uniref:Uncharacterized protein n=1 Tax=Coffea canephora TaxID=49390 RepID=A0A068UZH8_COFCA|nr:unnamed protein product [Coffea canephora]
MLAGKSYASFDSKDGKQLTLLDHLILVTTTLAAIGGLWFSTRKLELHPAICSLIGSIVGVVALQVTLRVSTLLSYVPVSPGSWHSSSSWSSNASESDASAQSHRTSADVTSKDSVSCCKNSHLDDHQDNV